MTVLRSDPADRQAAGLAALQNYDYFLTELLKGQDGHLAIEVRRRSGPIEAKDGNLIASVPVALIAGNPVRLRMFEQLRERTLFGSPSTASCAAMV